MKNLTLFRRFIVLVYLFLFQFAQAQQYPVQVTPVLIPPYSLKLGDYATTNENKLQLQLLMTDLMEPSHQIRLRFSLESGLNATPIAISNQYVNGMRDITLSPGVPLILTNIDLRSLFQLQNLSGISASNYTKTLPQGQYNFCFEVVDSNTGRTLSRKSCATAYFVQYDPPMLSLPQNKELVQKQNEIQNIVFQWMPRQLAPNTHYIFTIKEIWDLQRDPVTAFLSSPVLWKEKVYSNSLFYGFDKTQLLVGKRYAWQVQAKSGNPVLGENPTEDNGVYKNNGLSEIFYFDYIQDCKIPSFLSAKNAGRGRVEVRWSYPGEKPNGLYRIQYRKRGTSNAWMEQEAYQEMIYISGLADKTEYEYRVGAICGLAQTFNNSGYEDGTDNAYSYSTIQYFRTNSEDISNTIQCGMMPNINITNKRLLQESFVANEIFMAGDFPVTIIRAEGKGTYSGEGYIVVPYLGDTKVKVLFNNIKINTDRQLISGVIETTYDPTESSVPYVSSTIESIFGDGEIKEIRSDFPIDSIVYSATPPPGTITIIGKPGKNGEEPPRQTYPGGRDTMIIDNEGNAWEVDKEGKISKVEVAEGGVSTGQNTDGISGIGKKAEINQYTAKGIELEWKEISFKDKETPYTKFSFDTKDKTNLPLSDYQTVKDNKGKIIAVPYKLVVNGQTDILQADVKLTDASLKDGKIVFKILSSGKKIETTETKLTETIRRYKLTLKGAYNYQEEDVIAVIVPKDSLAKQQVVSSFKLVHLKAKKAKVHLVPLDQKSIGNLTQIRENLTNIYKSAGVDFEIVDEDILDISELGINDRIESGDPKIMSTYGSDQKKINNHYLNTRSKELRYVLFVTEKQSSTGQVGYMRLNGQFGYVFGGAPIKTAAHELGHGIFKLEHPKASNTNVLMDYSPSELLSHKDWQQIGDPAFKFYGFQDQSEGEFKEIQLTPDWEPFKYTGSSVYVSGTIQSPNGAVHGIAMCKNNDCSENTLYYWKTVGNVKGYYAEGISKPLDIVTLSEKEKNENPPITLFWNYGTCGYNKTYTTTWNYIKDKEDEFDITKVLEEGSVKEGVRVPCIDGSGSTVNPNESCQGKDVVEINKGYNKVLSILDSSDKSIIIKTINETDLCSLRLLKYDEFLKLFTKLSSDNTIANGKENAIVKLIQVVKTEHFNDFLTLLQADNNKILKNLMFKVDDQTAFYGSNNYTALVRLFGQMFNEVNKETIKNISKDEVKAFTVVQNSYLVPTNGEKIFQIYFQYNQPEFRISQGVWEVTQNCDNTGVIPSCTSTQRVKYEEPVFVKPFDMVALTDNSDYNLVSGISDGSKTVPVVPALFLYYAHSKGEVENVKIYLQNTLDVVTLAVPVTKIATGPRWLAKTFTFVDKWSKVNAVANLAINNSELSKIPELKAALDAYNAVTAVMNVTTLAGAIGKGQIAKFFTELDNPAAKKALIEQAKRGNKDAEKILDVEAELKAYSEAKEGKGWWKSIDDVINTVYKNVKYDDFIKTFTATEEQYKKAYRLWGQEKWDELYEYFKTNKINYDDNIKDVWPPFYGAKKINKIEIGYQLKEKIFDRFQEGKYADGLGGSFASPVLDSKDGVADLVFTYDSRALANKIKDGTYYYKFKIKDDVPDLVFEYGEAIPWFKLMGNADQIKSNLKFNDILDHIEIIEKLKFENGKWINVK